MSEARDSAGMIGRESELLRLLRAIERRESLLLWGPPGSGKSALLQTALDSLPDGVHSRCLLCAVDGPPQAVWERLIRCLFDASDSEVLRRFDNERSVAQPFERWAGATAMLLCVGSRSPWLLGLIFLLAGSYVGIEEALEDSLAAELAPRAQHGMAFGTLAAVNAVGDFVSSLFVGLLWSAFSAQAAFAAAAILFCAGAVLVARLR